MMRSIQVVLAVAVLLYAIAMLLALRRSEARRVSRPVLIVWMVLLVGLIAVNVAALWTTS